jgi:hypothetical protein
VKSEAQIQREILLEIGSEPDLLLLVNSVGRAKYESSDGKPYTVPYGLGVGSPDLVGLLAGRDGLARWFALEVKRDGEEPRPEQVKCHEIWKRRGALVYVARSAADARAALEDARGRI